MIRSITKIKSFGVFADFKWPPRIPDFKQYNLIYGWNYSGKTTLSRVFQCFEKRQGHLDFPEAQVQLEAANGAVHDLSTPHTSPVFRVFNSDFVRDNLIFSEGRAIPILVLGDEDIAKHESLQAKKDEREALTLSKSSNEQKKNEIKAEIQKKLTKYARDFIKYPLAVPNYDKTRFERSVNECKANPAQDALDDSALAEYLSVYRSTAKKPSLSSKVFSLSAVAELEKKTATLLARVVTANIPILRLKENPAVESWVNEGRTLHNSMDTCQFCGQRLPDELMTDLSGHFSAAYDNFMGDLNNLVKTIQAAQEEEITLDHKSDFYPELSERFTTQKSKLDRLLKARNSVLIALATALVAKQTKVFTCLDCPSIDDPTDQIAAVVEAINKIIAEHNSRTAEFHIKRQEAFTKLEKHYAALFILEEKYNKHVQNISNLEASIVGQGAKIVELGTDIRILEQALSKAEKGAERINELLVAYFGKNDLRIVVSDEKRFHIVRGDASAKNLSEGEKTAIAFAYFITRVQDGRHPLADTRIVIDDPISSLDANHHFNTYALIKTQLVGCCQLFISTHSFEFYNLIREWVADDEGSQHAKKPQTNWKKWSVLYVKRTDDGGAVLEEIPRELLRFKSEYHYLFSTLYHFDKAGSADFDCLLSLPNVVRRFMEAFGGIMIPRWAGLHGKMPKLFPDEIKRERVWKFINHYSHNTTITRSLTIPDTSECRAVVQACLEAVQNWDTDYFKDLEAEVS
ncbi:MAG TPA: AAA family ATPase [Nitrospirales bacterium]|nr:hypothetical protein [Nitrospiraceae bacterium]HNP31351.1 AAA family ATPase [Nitrospirales bacterium]